MAEEYIPELTLNPNSPLGSAVQAAPAAPQVQESTPLQDLPASDLDESKLSEAERKTVEEFAQAIDLSDSNMILQYGSAAQKHVSDFSETTLQQIRTKDLGEIGDTLAGLVRELQSFDAGEEKKGIGGFFRKKKDQLETLKAGYAKASANVDKIAENLERHQITLMKDVANLDQMYELNARYQKELTMYILAGKKKLAQVRATDLVRLQEKASSGSQEDAQAYNDLANYCTRFEKKLHDLELTRMIALQMGPQTRLLQNNDTLMIEKIQSSLVNTIPLWKSQMVLALGLEHSRQATASQNAVTEMTNTLLKQNADMLKMGTIETAREAERSVVDLETLKHTNQQLVESLDEVMRIQSEGAQKRRETEAELAKIEGELKQKLLELRG
ncbi:MAG: toxic anion resistance protein [Ruminiclostridium sp.]|nr:toxic anion resistance protein [Ruminiclostridium sp.]